MRSFGAYDIYSCTGLFVDETKRSNDERRLSCRWSQDRTAFYRLRGVLLVTATNWYFVIAVRCRFHGTLSSSFPDTQVINVPSTGIFIVSGLHAAIEFIIHTRASIPASPDKDKM